MAEHKLTEGKALIQRIVELGNILDYYVSKEFPVEKAEMGIPPAVDVAWLGDIDHKFPLMIFEIESTASNTMANNPLKVFAQENAKFEKPLFFFHLVLSKGSASTRISNLQRQYGAHNYRVYVIHEEGANRLINDILVQHRRIRTEISYVELYLCLSDKLWNGLLDADSALKEALNLNFSPNSRLRDYVYLTLEFPHLIDQLKMLLEEGNVCCRASFEQLPSWYGIELGMYPLCALMIRHGATKSEEEKWDSILLNWESNHCDFFLDSYILGESPDGDNFFLHTFPSFVGFCVAIAAGRGGLKFKLVDTLTNVLQQLEPCLLGGVEIASWLCNVTARCGMVNQFEIAQEYINCSGGVDEELLYSPPSITFGCDDDSEQYHTDHTVACPDIFTFQERALSVSRQYSATPCQLALTLLCDENYVSEYSEDILAALWERPAVDTPLPLEINGLEYP